MYDIDSKSAILSNHDFIGTSTCTLAQIVTAPPPGFQMVLTDSKKSKSHGTLVVSSEELAECRDDVKLQFLGKKLDRKDVFGSSDPFLQFSKSTEDGTFVVVHRTEVILNAPEGCLSFFLRRCYLGGEKLFEPNVVHVRGAGVSAVQRRS